MLTKNFVIKEMQMFEYENYTVVYLIEHFIVCFDNNSSIKKYLVSNNVRNVVYNIILQYIFTHHHIYSSMPFVSQRICFYGLALANHAAVMRCID